MAPVAPANADEVYLSISALAKEMNRSVWTIRRWERQGLLPNAKRIGGKRRYRQEDIQKLRQAAESSDLLHHQRRKAEFTVALNGRQAQLDHELECAAHPPRPWNAIAKPDPGRRSWTEITGNSTGTGPINLPEQCPHCVRRLVRVSTTLASGALVLSATCQLHGEIERQPWT